MPDVTLAATGDADVIAAPGAVARELVELLVHALEHANPGEEEVELAVTEAGDQAVVCAGRGRRAAPADCLDG